MKVVRKSACWFITLLAFQQISGTAWAEDLELAPRADDAVAEQAYERAIMDIESREGAYGDNLAESLLGLANVLQSQGKHGQAIEVFRRGTHLTRINDGLYSATQIPLLLGEINSHRARGDYAQVDDRQDYLYRVQLKSLEGTAQLGDALMSQALWQLDAYKLRVGGTESYNRLVNMLELNRMAMQDVLEREGDESPNLLPPLHGMLQAQYLISSHEVGDSSQLFGEDGRPNESLLRFKSYKTKSYRQGRAIIIAIDDIQKVQPDRDPGEHARTLVMLGDWHLWNGQAEDAWEVYRTAQTELAGLDGAQEQEPAFFSEPVPLPDFTSINPLPPMVTRDDGDIQFAFTVSERGRVYDLERMDEPEEEGRSATQLMRALRKTRFRPKFEAGEPVETENVVRAFDFQ